MSQLQRLQLVPIAPAPWYRRALDTLRSITLGPINARDPAAARLFGYNPTSSGISVDEARAYNLAAVWCAVVVIAGGVSKLPLDLMRRSGERNNKERYVDHPTYELVHSRPNPEMTSLVFRRTLQAHALTWGNGYAEIERDTSDRPLALWPLTPNRVMPYREGNGPLRYRVLNETTTGYVDIDADDMLHIPGLGFDGICGYSVIGKARESLGLSLATERFGAQFFGNGSSATGVYQHPKALSDTAFGHLRDSLKEHHGGEKNRSPIILEEGMTWQQLTVAPDDGQFLQTRKFQVEEVARWFNLPPHKLKDLDRATFSNIEQQSIEFVNESLMDWLVCWEQELNRKLIRPLERRQQFFKHNVNALLRGDIQSRFNAYAVGRQWGWLSANDIRDLEDMNSIGVQGDIYLTPANMYDAKNPPPVPPPTPPSPAPVAEPAEDDDEPARARHAETQATLAAFAQRFDDLRTEPRATPEQVEALRVELVALAALVESVRAQSAEASAEHAQRQEAAIASIRAAFDAIAPPEPDAIVRADVGAVLSQAERTHDLAATTAAEVREVVASVAAMRDVVTAPPPEPDTSMAEAVAAIRAEQAAHADVLRTILERLTPPEPPAAPVAEEPAEPAPAPSPSREVRQIVGHRAAVEDAVRRMLRREALHLRRTSKSAEALRAKVASMYEKNAAVFAAILQPSVQAHLGFIGSTESAEDATRRLVDAYISESRAKVHEVLDRQPSDLRGAVDAMIDRWERDRPAAFARALMEEELAHAGT